MTKKNPQGFQAELSTFQSDNGLAGLGATIWKNGKLSDHGVAGERERSTGSLIESDDKWHIGSITKSITATMIGRLIEKGLLNWDTNLGTIFQRHEELHDDWKKTTILDLLTHTSGAKANFPLSVLLKRPTQEKEILSTRQNAVYKQLQKPPLSSSMTRFLYSNVGYTIAGLAAETVAGKSWESLVQEEVFDPLNLHSAGFGAPNEPNQPHGHKYRFLRRGKTSVPADTDNTAIMAPAGCVHMNLHDLAQFGHEHLSGQHGNGRLLKKGTYKILHQASLESYACGWVLNDNGILWHNGSNTMWYAFLGIIPRSNTVIAVTANDPDIKISESFAISLLEKASSMT